MDSNTDATAEAPGHSPTHVELGFWARLWLAIILPWKILFNGRRAARVQAALAGRTDALPPAETPALQLLSIMQREGRFIDFLQEDVASYSDSQVGAAARVVHEGCRRGLRDYIELAPIRSEREGAPVVLEAGFDASRTRLTGAVHGQPPFAGRLAHHGWQVTAIHLPLLTDGHDPKVVAPAEVELS